LLCVVDLLPFDTSLLLVVVDVKSVVVFVFSSFTIVCVFCWVFFLNNRVFPLDSSHVLKTSERR
jgi:hypothetical protein